MHTERKTMICQANVDAKQWRERHLCNHAMVEQPIVGINASLVMVTKGGLEAITRSLAMEYAKQDIRFNAVAPMGEISGVADIVDTIVYLTEARYVTGETLHVDAGAHNGKW
jgi:NAD(P)-dependent dehydrogenase (short-subunit alcohol dehydrogenase family)